MVLLRDEVVEDSRVVSSIHRGSVKRTTKL